MPTLHYIYDPFCGWCYGAAPLLKATESMSGVQIQLHGGGMMMGPRKQHATPEWRAMVLQYDERIAAMSGQPFGAAYHNGLLQDPTTLFDSEPPTTAIVAAEKFGKGIEMLHKVQEAHFVEGRKIADASVLADLAQGIGISRDAFEKTYGELNGEQTLNHIAESRSLLGQAGGQGFPTFVLETENSAIRLEHGPYLGKPDAWASRMQVLLEKATTA